MARERVGDPWRSKEAGSFLVGTVLWTVDRLAPLLRVFGIDFALFRELLSVRMLLSLRSPSMASAGAGVMRAAGIMLTFGATAMAGIFTGIVALTSERAETWVVLSQSVLLGLLALLLFQILAGILVDPTDIGVVAPHPVSDRTLFAVRLAEVSSFVALFGVGFTGGNVLLAVLGKPPLAVLFVFPLLSLACAATALGAVAFLFALILRLVGPTHFQRVTLWVQIVVGIVLVSAGQLVRLVHPGHWELPSDELVRLKLLWPPFQYAEVFAWVSGAGREFPLVSMLATVLTPIVALALTLWLASRYFIAGLQGTLSAPRPHARWPGGLVAGFGARLTRGAERAAFDFAAALSRREPQFLRGVLPQLVMYQAMSIAMGAGRYRDMTIYIPLSAGFLFLVLPNVLMLGQSSSTPEAGALFASAPVEDEGALVRGGVKALIVQWVGLPAALLFLVQLVIAGPEALPRVVLAIELGLAATLAYARFYELRVPFTVPVKVGAASAANVGLVMSGTLVLGVVIGVHWVLSLHPLALAAGIAGCGALLVRLWRRLGGIRSAPEQRRRRAAALRTGHGA